MYGLFPDPFLTISAHCASTMPQLRVIDCGAQIVPINKDNGNLTLPLKGTYQSFSIPLFCASYALKRRYENCPKNVNHRTFELD